jgi:DNA-binding IclR family transcriptional regulator
MVSANSVGEPVTAKPKPLAAAIAVLVAIERVTDEDTRGER